MSDAQRVTDMSDNYAENIGPKYSAAVTTNSLKNLKTIERAYFLGYKTGLTNHIGAGENFDLDLTEKQSLAWLDGWLDGVEAAEKQCSKINAYEVQETTGMATL